MSSIKNKMREVVFQKSADTGYIYCMHCGEPIPRGHRLLHFREWEIHERCFPAIERIERMKDKRKKEQIYETRHEVEGLYRTKKEKR